MEVVVKNSSHKNMVMESWLQMDVVAKSSAMNTMVENPNRNYWGIPGYRKWMEELLSGNFFKAMVATTVV